MRGACTVPTVAAPLCVRAHLRFFLIPTNRLATLFRFAASAERPLSALPRLTLRGADLPVSISREEKMGSRGFGFSGVRRCDRCVSSQYMLTT